MQKKLLAIAVAGALAPAAAMAQSTVEIYGRANVGLDQWQAKGATDGTGDYKGRMRVFDFGSRLGFRVNESLGGGMRAFVVMETGVNIDSGTNNGQSTSANASTGFWASRDSYAGIGGDWGDVRFGRQSPFYSNGIIMQAGSNYINQAMDSAFSFAGPLAQPTGRESNILSYNSPTLGGFNASLSWARARARVLPTPVPARAKSSFGRLPAATPAARSVRSSTTAPGKTSATSMVRTATPGKWALAGPMLLARRSLPFMARSRTRRSLLRS